MFLYHIRPSKYVKYPDVMTYGNCHTPVLEYSVDLLLQFKRPTSKLGQVFAAVLSQNIGICMILDEQNHLSWLNTLQSRYYIQGLFGGCNFLTVAPRDTCAAERR